MIGIFDSGSGGLTVLRAIRDVLPSCDVVYFGDIRNAPYGSKSNEELSLLTVEAIKLLQSRGATKIVSACNSVSASLAVSLFDALDIAPARLIEMVGPTVSFLKDTDKKLLICATPATVRSGIYQNAFAMAGKKVETLAIPDLAGAVELGKPRQEIEDIVSAAFDGAPEHEVLVLACTHYPLVLESFKKALPHKVIFDPAAAVAERAQKLFWPQEVGSGSTSFLISKESPIFRRFVREFFPDGNYSVKVVE